MSKRQKTLVLTWGLIWLSIGALAGLVFLVAAVESDWRLSLAVMAPLFAGMIGGGVVAFSALRALGKARAWAFRLPPAWALAGGFVMALAVGLGLWHADVSKAFLGPIFVALAAALAPLAVVSWIVGQQSGAVNARRGWTSFGLGATAAASAAYLLNTLLSAAVLFLIFGLVETLQPLAEELLTALEFGTLTGELLSPWFLVTLVEIAVIAPLVEELIKPLPLLPLLKRITSQRDALLLGVLAGAGFAAVENLLYTALVGPAWGGVLAMRVMGSALHSFGTGLMAVAWWRLLRREPGAAKMWARNYGLAVGAHALWNGTCVVAATVANAWFRGWEVELLGVTDAVLLVSLLAAEGIGLLVALRALTRRLEPADEKALPLIGSTERLIAIWGLVCLIVLLPVGLGVLRTVW
ncbi:MAG TPA: PrsW family glutamic-type intramembrane protease [Anaerolineae bacterium]|nr:PrsW family glutamic-type intramembrane protease [Anaerolineae bacterium]